MNAAISTHATIMHFAICLPDWNSLDSVRRIHSDLEGAALVFFALLVVCEALAHLWDDKRTERRFDKIGIVFFAIAVLADIAAYSYGQRNDTLSEQVIVSLDATARDAAGNASTALTNSREAETKSKEAVEKAGKSLDKSNAANDAAGKAQEKVAGVEKRADDADKKLARLQFLVLPRQGLLMEKAGLFVTAMKPFAPQAIEIKTDPEYIRDPNDIAETNSFHSTIRFLLGQVSGWSISEGSGWNGWGVSVVVRHDSSPETQKAAKALASALGDCGITGMNGERPESVVAGEGSDTDRENGPPNTIILRVGEHPK